MLIRKLGLATGFVLPPIVLNLIILLTSKELPYPLGTIVLGIFAYSFILNAVYLASKPKWIDNLIGLQNAYIFHIVLGSGAALFAIMHMMISVANGIVVGGVTGGTGYIGLAVLVIIVLFSMPLLNGYLKATVAFARKWFKKVSKFLSHENIVNIHRINILVVVIIFIHVSSMSFFRGNLLFFGSFLLYTLVALGSFIANKVRESRFLFRGVVSNIRSLNYNTTELTISVNNNNDKLHVSNGDFVYISFPDIKELKELHPFSVVNVSLNESETLITLAIREDGDWTTRVAMIETGQEVVLDASYGIIHRSVMNPTNKYLVIMIGGNGVTPVVNLLKNAINKENYQGIYVYWSLKKPEDAIYLSNLNKLAEQNHILSINVYYHRLRLDDILNHIPDIQRTTFLILGSSVMVQSTKKRIKKLGKLNRKQIVTEGFAI